MNLLLKFGKNIAFNSLLFLFETTNRTHVFKVRIQDHRLRTLRASLLKRAIRSLQGTMVQCNFPGQILVESNGEAFLKEGEIFLSLEGTSRFLKVTGRGPVNEGREIHDFYQSKFGCSPTSILDIGSNVGEISLYFAQLESVKQIRSIEPIPRNISIFEKNMKKNPRFSEKIELIAAAVSNDDICFMIEDRAESRVVKTSFASSVTIKVETIAFDDAVSNFNSSKWDLVKIDIEGYELSLLDDILDKLEYAECWLIEIHPIGNEEKYLKFVTGALRKKYRIIDRYSNKEYSNMNEADLLSLLSKATDIYIVRFTQSY